MSTVKNLWVPQIAGKFLTSWGSVRLSMCCRELVDCKVERGAAVCSGATSRVIVNAGGPVTDYSRRRPLHFRLTTIGL